MDRPPLPVFALARDGTIVWLNGAARDIVGDGAGDHFSKVVAAESLPLVRREFVKKIVAGAASTEYDAHLLAADGRHIPVEISSVPLRGEGRIVGVFGAARVEGEPIVPSVHAKLTPRQVEVLKLLAQGSTTEQIAARLGLADDTVRNHIRHILRRLGAHSPRGGSRGTARAVDLVALLTNRDATSVRRVAAPLFRFLSHGSREKRDHHRLHFLAAPDGSSELLAASRRAADRPLEAEISPPPVPH